jgi:hypothetical protein
MGRKPKLWLENKRCITTNSVKKARKNRTYNYRYEGRGPKTFRWGTTHWEAQDI